MQAEKFSPSVSNNRRDLKDLRFGSSYPSGIADLLAHQRLRQWGNVGKGALAWVRLILAHDPVALAAPVVTRDGHRTAEVDCGEIRR